MISNPATKPANEINNFTHLVQLYSKQNWKDRRDLWVQLRNGHLVRPLFMAAEDETCEDCFGTDAYRWNLDGTSFTRRDYDMMEIITND